MTKFLIKREGQRSVQPPAAPISLRMNAQAMIITHEAAQDLQGPQLYLVTCSLPPSLTSFKAPSSLGRPSGLPLRGLCAGCPSARTSISPLPLPSHLQTSHLGCFPWALDRGPTLSLPPTLLFQRRVSSLSGVLQTLLIHFVDYVTRPSSPHCHFPGTRISV